MNSHTWLKAVPPTISAGPTLRAGFTGVPVIGMPTGCATVSAGPMTMLAVAAFPILPPPLAAFPGFSRRRWRRLGQTGREIPRQREEWARGNTGIRERLLIMGGGSGASRTRPERHLPA